MSSEIDELLAINESEILTLIDEGVEITGKIYINNGTAILITGTVVGEIISNGLVIVNLGGVVRGSIAAKGLQVAGTVERLDDDNLINIDGTMVLSDTAVINCNAVTRGIKTAHGAVMRGHFSPQDALVNEDEVNEVNVLVDSETNLPGRRLNDLVKINRAASRSAP